VVVRLKTPVPDEVANMLQWLLGDDDKRVMFNQLRIEAGYKDWNKLFIRS
jgi:hypothetical protein